MYESYKSLAFFLILHLFSEEAEFTNCLGNLDKKLPEQCQISKSEGQKCQEWLRNNRNTFQKTLDPCLEQL